MNHKRTMSMRVQLLTDQQKTKLAETVMNQPELTPGQNDRIKAYLTHKGSLVWVNGPPATPTAVAAVTNEAGLLIINYLSPPDAAEAEVIQILQVVKKYASDNNFRHILLFAHGAKTKKQPYNLWRAWTDLGYRRGPQTPWLEMPKLPRNQDHGIALMILDVEKVHTETTNKQTNRQRSNRKTANKQLSLLPQTKKKKVNHDDSTDWSSEMNSTEYSVVSRSSSSNTSSCNDDEFGATSSSDAGSSYASDTSDSSSHSDSTR